jgi:Short C-terminal domain
MKFPIAATPILLLCLAFAEAKAQSNVLVAPLPQGLDSAQVLEIARQVLTARNWTVQPGGEEGSVEAENANSRIRVFVAGTALRYVDQSRRPRGIRGRNYRADGMPQLAAVSQEVIDELRADFTAALTDKPAALAGKPAALAGKPAAPPSQVLLGNIPPRLDPARVMDAVRGALAGRRWSMLPDEDSAVVARIRSGDTESTLKVFLADGALRFIDRTTFRNGAEKAQVPERWINYLRADLGQALAALPVRSAADEAKATPREPARQPGNAAERLRTLKQLLDAGLISQEEYDKKRAETLREL